MPYTDKEKQKEFQNRYRKNKSKSGMSGAYYQWYKFLQTLKEEELQMLYEQRKKQCKYATTEEESQRTRTEIKIISDVLKELQHNLEKIQ